MNIFLPIGPVMLDVAGLYLTDDEREILKHPNTGAVILFARNYQSPDQIIDLIRTLRAARKGPLLIAVDQEGGRVQRFQTGFTRLPPAAFYARAPELAQSAGWLMAAELLAVGVDFSFAPVLDVDCGISEIIGDRAFASEATRVAQLAGDFRKGMKAAGMAAVGKHFPGHGGVALDSHLTLPEDTRALQALQDNAVQPFRQLIGEGLEGIMPAHVVYPAVDPLPAGFSAFWLQRILRGELGFDGAIFSDDLSMAGAAVAGDFPERAQLAQQAGCDMLLVCNNPAAAVQVLQALPIKENPERQRRLMAMQSQATYHRNQLLQTDQWLHCSSLIDQLTDTRA